MGRFVPSTVVVCAGFAAEVADVFHDGAFGYDEILCKAPLPDTLGNPSEYLKLVLGRRFDNPMALAERPWAVRIKASVHRVGFAEGKQCTC